MVIFMCRAMTGIEVGHQFFSRAEMVVVGCHQHWLAGIDFIGGTAETSRKNGKKMVILSQTHAKDAPCAYFCWVTLKNQSNNRSFRSMIFFWFRPLIMCQEQVSEVISFLYSLRSIVIESFCHFGTFHSSRVISFFDKSQHIFLHLLYSLLLYSLYISLPFSFPTLFFIP